MPVNKNVYYRLSLKTHQKPSKRVCFRHEGRAIVELNTIANTILENYRRIKREKRKNDNVSVLKLFERIIPLEYFGSKKNRKLFEKIVAKILTQSVFECIFKKSLTQDFDLDAINWLRRIPQEHRDRFLCKVNSFLLDGIVKNLILFYYKPVKTFKGNEMRFIRKETWLSYESRIFARLLASKSIVPACDSATSSRGILKIVPKGELSELKYRPLVSIFQDNTENREIYRKITAKIYHIARSLNDFSGGTSLFQNWKNFRLKVSEEKKIHAVKLDIRDAYGSVDIRLLCSLLTNLSEEQLSSAQKAFVVAHVTEQHVTFRKKVYQWQRGLLQGDRLSSCLCELYMSYLDRTFLSKFWNEENFLHRTVDDYFFCSTEEHSVYDFLTTVEGVHTVNADKTSSDVSGIPYCGKLFNVESGEVKTIVSFEKRYEIRHKFKLWNFKRQIAPECSLEFLKRSMNFAYNSHSFDSLLINTIFNGEQTVLENFYDSMICLAYKFDVTVQALKNWFTIPVLQRFVVKIVREYSSRIHKKLQLLKGANDKSNITFKLLEVIAFRAFLLVFKKRNESYKNIITAIESENRLSLFVGPALDFSYFTKIPSKLQNVKLNRKCLL